MLLVIAFSGFAWFKSWFIGLCGAVVLYAFLEHPDMPRAIFGVMGLNLWNFLIINVFLAWWVQRRNEGLEWDMPRRLGIAVMLYMVVIVAAYLRLIFSPAHYMTQTSMQMLVNYLVNPLKFLVPFLLFYDGCRTKGRMKIAVLCIISVYLLLSIQTIKYMGLNFQLSGDELQKRAVRLINNAVGFHRVDMSMMLAGASWACFAVAVLFDKLRYKWILYAGAATIFLGQALTGGRAGYVTWGLVGLTMCLIKWRRLLPLIPVGALGIVVLMPGVQERMTEGFGSKSGPIVEDQNSADITSGRTNIWPHVVDEIGEAPVFGHGRAAMITTGLANFASIELGEVFSHPHNAYLEMLLDSGLVGLLCTLPLYLLALYTSWKLFIDRGNRIHEAVGGVGLALTLALLFAGMGAQTLFPREGVMGMWAIIGISLRAYQNRALALEYEEAEEDEDEDVEILSPASTPIGTRL